MKTVFVVEGYPSILAMWKDVLVETPISIVSAVSLEEARWGFSINKKELDAIVICARVGDLGWDTPDSNTLELVAEFRKEFKGPMIASSSIPEWREKLMEAGCDMECTTDKKDIPKLLKELFGV